MPPSLISLSASEVLIDAVQPRTRYLFPLSVRNTSSRGQRVRFIPPRSPAFSLAVENDVELAPGLEVRAELSFFAAEAADLDDQLIVCAGGEERAVLPIRVRAATAALRVAPAVEFGELVVGRGAAREFAVANEGKCAGSVFLSPQVDSPFHVTPLEAEVPAGGSVSFKVEFAASALGVASAKLPISMAAGGTINGKPAVELLLKAECVKHRLELRDAQGAPLREKLAVGALYYGQERRAVLTLVNNGPIAINWAMGKPAPGEAGEPEEAADLPPSPESDAITFSPSMGAMQPYSSMQVEVHFSPKRSAEPETITSQQDLSHTVAVTQVFEVLETGQRLPLTVEGEALLQSLHLSQNGLSFGECAQYDHREMIVKLTNRQELPFHFSIGAVANFSAKPAEGKLGGNETIDLLVSFSPHQLGTLRGALPISGFGGKLRLPPLRVQGECTRPSKRAPLGGADKLPEDFLRPPQLVGAAASPPPPPPWSRAPPWEASAACEGTNLSVLQALRKRKTYAAQQAQQGLFDAIDQRDTGLELTSDELRASAAHRQFYDDFLKTARAEREAAQRKRHTPAKEMEDFDFGASLGLEAFSGLSMPVPNLPREREPLWLKTPYDSGGELRTTGMVLFDQMRPFIKKYKPRPENSDEIRECRQALSAKELLMVTGGPKTIDFGTVSVFTKVVRNFTVMNELRSSCLVEVVVGDEAELAGSTPASQVIPPGASSGFDIVFSSAEPMSYRRTVKYILNGLHAFKFTVTAEVVPIDVSLSTEELSFKFKEGSLEQTMRQPVTLTNNGTYPARFRFENAADFKGTPAFIPFPAEGEVAPSKSVLVDVQFAPVLGSQTEHVLSAVVEGGPLRHLYCKAEISEAKAAIVPKVITFGTIAAGVPKEKAILVKNAGQVDAAFAFEPPPAGVAIRPMRGCVRPGGSMEVTVELTSAKSQTIEATLVAAVRCGRPIKVALKAEAVVPDVTIIEEELDFGGIVVGARSSLPLTLHNRSAVPARMLVDLSAHAEFALAPPDGGESDATRAAEEEPPVRLLPAADGKRVYALLVPPHGTLPSALSFSPRAVKEHVFELPLAPSGLPAAAATRRAVAGEGLVPRLKLSETVVNLGERIIRNTKFPYVHTLTVSNAVDEPLRWEIDVDALPASSGFTLLPTSGELPVGGREDITLHFAPTTPGQRSFQLPLHLNDGRAQGARPYLHLSLEALAATPRLSFELPEVHLLAVPLGHVATASLFLINEGYDNLLVRHAPPADAARLPLSVDFPEGLLVGVSKPRLPMTVSFTAKKPMSFTAPVELLDNDGHRFTLHVTCATDNCLLTLQPFLSAKGGAVQVLAREGKPLMLSEAPPAAAGALALNPSAASDEALHAAASRLHRAARVAVAYIGSIMTLPAEGGFPQVFAANKAQPALELCQLLCGKPVPLPPEGAAERKSEKLALRHAVGCFEALLAFLQAHGAALAHVKAESLMPAEAFLQWAAHHNRSHEGMAREHAYRHLEAWHDLLLQIIKLFVLGRITPRTFRTLPGMGEAAAALAKDPTLSGSNLYSVAEVLLLKWLSHHHASLHPEEAAPRLVAFDGRLADGHVFAAAILSHCPFMAGRGKRTPQGGDPPAGSALDVLHPPPCGAKEAVENLEQVLLALGALGAPFAIKAEALHKCAPRELLLFTLFLYQTLPHYVPKASVEFQGGLHKLLAKSIELSNPSKKPIVYEVRLEGASCFSVASTSVRLEPRSSTQFDVHCTSRFMGRHSGRLLFLSKGNGVSTANASTLVFGLEAAIDIGAPVEIVSVEAKLYVPLTFHVTVANPFDRACTLRLSMNETRPELLLPSPEKDKAAANEASLKKATRAAFQAGGGADDIAARLPASFWSGAPPLALEARGTAQLAVQFLPFQLGEYSCTCLFSDAAVGEFSYELRGTAALPPPLETLSLSADASTSVSKELVLPFRNPLVEKARAAVLERSAAQREKMSALWGKEPLLRGPLSLQVSFSSHIFSAAATSLELTELRQRGGGRSQGSTACASMAGSVAASAAGTPRSTSCANLNASAGGKEGAKEGAKEGGGGGAEVNKLVVRFVPKEPGNYSAEMLLLSPLDVRVYELSASCSSPGVRACLEFHGAARGVLRQEVPLVNGMDIDWNVSAQIKGDDFRGPPTLKVAAHSTALYPIEFCPQWTDAREGELLLSNLNTGDKYNFALKGSAEEPLAERHVVLQCVARQPQQLRLPVFNVSKAGAAATLAVQSDLMHVSGAPSVGVPPRERGSRPAEAAAEYTLVVNSQMGGTQHGSITFTAADGRYMWYTVELQSAPPPAEREIEIRAPLRKVVAVEIPISNPAAAELEFGVFFHGAGLLGDETVCVPAGQTAMYELLFSPLVAGESEGSISFVHPVAGEFWYQLKMVAEEALPVELPLLHCAVGGKTTHSFTVANPVGEELPLQVHCDNTRNFKLEGARGGTIVLPPYGEATATLSFTPSQIDQEAVGTIALTHPMLGEWLYHARGLGLPPADSMPPTEITAPLGHTTSSTIAFRNPFETPLTLTFAMEQADGSSEGASSFELLARRPRHGVELAAFNSMQLPFSFLPRTMTEHHAKLSVRATYQGKALEWTFPIVGVAVSRPLQKPIVIATPARQPLVREIQLPIPGLAAHAVEEAFTFDLDVADEDAEQLARTLTLTPMQRTLSGATLRMSLDWRPLRPLRTSCALVVRKSSGGRWRYDLALEAGEPEPDDVIHIEAGINKPAAVSFRLANAFDVDSGFQAYFTSDTPSVFSVSPVSGVLPRAGAQGHLFTVTYAPMEYGKPVQGVLVILTNEMQWSYEVRGTHPQYQTPVAARDPSRLHQPLKRGGQGSSTKRFQG